MTIAITGATGFVGSHVLDAAAAAGVAVRALARKPQPQRDAVTWIAGALDDAAALDALCEGASALLHIAGAVNVPSRAAFAAANIAGTQAVVDAAMRGGAARFVHVSSLAAREPALSNYGWSKADAEDVVRAAPLPWAIVRPPGVYGPRDHDMLELFAMARKGLILLPPAGRGSWIHAADLAALLVTLATTAALPAGALFEVDDGAPGGVSHRDMGAAIAAAVGRPGALRFSAPRPLIKLAAHGDRLVRGDKAKLTPDRAAYMAHPDWVSDPAKRPDPALWTPKIPFTEGLAATAAWYRAAGWLR
ncbi:MAG: NAD(P)H-binding protein [Sphingopyxis sp.]|nr:NAD(P)H-binding protein [Sphingopyxis sp.]